MRLKNQNICLAADYLRLSREDGDKAESDSIRNQRELITDFVKQHPDIKLVDEYVDDGYSGTNFERPDFQRLLEDIKKKKVNCIIVKDLSRLGRNYIETGRYLEKIFPFLGVRFISVTDHYDSANEKGEADQIIIPFKNLINDAYCRDISIKIRSQLDIKRKKGKFIGSFACYGYRKDANDKNHLVVDDYAAEIVQIIFKLKLEGVSSQGIAEKLNELGVLPPKEYKRTCGLNYNSGFSCGSNTKWAAMSVTRILKNEIYMGTMVQGKNRKINYKVKQSQPLNEDEWIRVPNMHEAIITPEIFQNVQELFELDTRTAPSEDAVYLFSGIISCGDCGENMVRRCTNKNGKKYYYYHCSTYKNKEGCSAHLISEKFLSAVIIDSINHQIQLLVNAEQILNGIGELPTEKIGVKTIQSQMISLHEEIERYKDLKMKLYQDMVEGLINQQEFQDINKRFSEKMEQSEHTLSELEQKKKRMQSKEIREVPWIEEFKKHQSIEHLERKELVSLVERITIHSKEKIEIRFRFAEEMDEYLANAQAVMQWKEDEGVAI